VVGMPIVLEIVAMALIPISVLRVVCLIG